MPEVETPAMPAETTVPPAAGPPAAASVETPAAPTDATPPEWEAQRKALREEAAGYRIKAKDSQTKLEAVLKAAGIIADDDPVAAAQKAAEQRDAAIAQVQSMQRENAIIRLAGKAGANADALTDSLSFRNAVDAIDPAAPDFSAQVELAIKTAVDANPNFRTSAVAPERSGGPVGGGQTPVAEYSAEWVHEMATKGRHDLIVKAKDEGKLATLLAGDAS